MGGDPNPGSNMGNAGFQLIELQGNGFAYRSLAPNSTSDQVILTRSNFNIVLLNGPPPYFVKVRQSGAFPVRVDIFNVGSSSSQLEAVTTTDGSEVCLVLPTTDPANHTCPPPDPLVPVSSPEVRFDVCTPTSGSSSCDIFNPTTSDFGPPITGSVGDPFGTRLIGNSGAVEEPDVAAPAVFFYGDPRLEITGIFRNPSHRLVQVQAVENGVPKESDSSTDDAIVNLGL